MKKCAIFFAVAGLFWSLVATAVVADPTDGSLVVPPETIGPQTLTHDGSTYFKVYEFFSWPNYLTGMGAGTPWRMEISGIDVTGVTGPSGRTVYFQLVNISPDGQGWWYWHSLIVNARLDVWGDNLDKDLFQCQETYDRTGLWDNLRSAGFNAGDLTRDHFDLRMDFYKENDADPWTVSPSYRLEGGEWTPFDGGSAATTNSWRFGAPEGQIWPDDGGVVLNVTFDHNAAGTVSFDQIRIVPEPGAIALLIGGLIGATFYTWRRRR
ncbi:MAG: PEP-CTERM sorting domain-containing protein [Pirellulales bacterium]|nr:PEP-CTERM sorting domain-containing protein [Pirellulales bacterium]